MILLNDTSVSSKKFKFCLHFILCNFCYIGNTNAETLFIPLVIYFFITLVIGIISIIYIIVQRYTEWTIKNGQSIESSSSSSRWTRWFTNSSIPNNNKQQQLNNNAKFFPTNLHHDHTLQSPLPNDDIASVFIPGNTNQHYIDSTHNSVVEFNLSTTPSSTLHTSSSSTNNHHNHIPQQSWEIHPKELKFGPRIGLGNVGEVYRGTYRHRTIAIKRLLGNWITDKDMVNRFREEISLMATMNHPNVLHFIGAVLDYRAGNMCLVTEYCARGTLYDVLHSNDILPWRIRIKMAWDIAKGMGYLHEQAHIIQRDLKTTNLLVTDHYEVKVADFGLSRIVAPVMETYCGTPATMAPEIVKQTMYDERVDVFSFAIIMWELATRCEPYPGLSGLQLALTVANEGLRPPVPAYVPSEWASLMVRAWDTNPANRPSFDTIQRTLHSMLDTLDEADALISLSMGIPSPTLRRLSPTLTTQQQITSKRKYYNAIMGKDIVFLNNNNTNNNNGDKLATEKADTDNNTNITSPVMTNEFTNKLETEVTITK